MRTELDILAAINAGVTNPTETNMDWRQRLNAARGLQAVSEDYLERELGIQGRPLQDTDFPAAMRALGFRPSVDALTPLGDTERLDAALAVLESGAPEPAFLAPLLAACRDSIGDLLEFLGTEATPEFRNGARTMTPAASVASIVRLLNTERIGATISGVAATRGVIDPEEGSATLYVTDPDAVAERIGSLEPEPGRTARIVLVPSEQQRQSLQFATPYRGLADTAWDTTRDIERARTYFDDWLWSLND